MVPVVEQAEPVELVPQVERPRPAPVRRAAPTTKPRAGDLVCGECGEGNAATRKFCRRCGESLAEAQLVKVRWWGKLRRKPKTLAAGTRPRRPGDGTSRRLVQTTVRRTRATLGALVLAFGLLAGFYPPLRTMVTQQVGTLKTKVMGVADSALAPVRPAAVQGPKSLPEHPPKAAFDTFTNTSWTVPWDDKKPPALTVTLDHPVALRKAIISSGDKANFAGHLRPATLEFTYSNEKTDIVQLTDTPEPQEVTLRNAAGVSSFTVEVLNVYQAQDAKTLALAEIELFGIG